MIKSTPDGNSRQLFEYTVTRDELFMLKDEGILSTKAYVYFALSLDYPDGALTGAGLNIAAFCLRWWICEAEFLSAIAFLSKKGVIGLRTNALQIESTDRAERRTRSEIKREEKLGKQKKDEQS